VSDNSGVAVTDSFLYFGGGSSTFGRELYKYDGHNISLVKDINVGGGCSCPYSMYGAGNKLYFDAYTAAEGNEPYVSDGTTAGTILLKDINIGSGDGDGDRYIAFNNKVYFTAYTDATGHELWATDGTPAGTAQVIDMNQGSDDGINERMIRLKNSLYLSMYNPFYGQGELYRMDSFPEIPAPVVAASYCQAQSDSVHIIVASPGAILPSNVYTLQMSDATGSFATPATLATVTSNASDLVIHFTIPPTAPIASGYRMRVTSSSVAAVGPISDSTFSIIRNCSIGISSVDEEAMVNVYPNPTTGNLQVNIADYSGAFSIELYDISGKLLLISKDNSNGQFQGTLHLGELSQGVYQMLVKTDKGNVNRRIMVIH